MSTRQKNRKFKIGLIGLTAELYQKKIPDLVKALSEFSIELNKVIGEFTEVFHIPIVYTKKQMEEACKKLKKDGVDGIILVFLSYSPSLIIAPVLKKYKDMPVLIWNTQKLLKIDEKFKSSDTFYNHGMHGVQDLASVLLREGMKFSLITGHYKDKSVIEKIEKWCKATSVANFLKNSKIARIGERFKDMGDFSIPDREVTKILGPEIVEIPVEKVAKQSMAIKKAEIEKTMESDRKNYKIDKNLDKKTHFISSRIELSLRKIISEEKLNGLGINFMAFKGGKGAEAIPFSAISKFIAEGFGYGGEGDVLCAASVLILQKLCGEGNFVEMFTTDYKNNRILFSHMGESNLKMAKNKKEIRLVKKNLDLIEQGLSTAMFLFPLKPGKVTLFNISPDKNSFRFIVSKGEILNKPLFKDIISPHFLLKVDGKVEDFLTEYSKFGGTHHLAMVYGDRKNDLRYLAEIMNIPFFEIKKIENNE